MPAAASRPTIVCVGPAIVDALGRPVSVIPEGQGRQLLDELRITAAGTGAGTAVDLAKLGARVTLFGAVGDDLLADFLGAALRVHGVNAHGLARKMGVQTSATILPIRANGERPALHCPGATSRLEASDIDLPAVRAADALHLGGPDVLGAFGHAPAGELLADAKQHGVVTSVDMLSPCDSGVWETVKPWLRHVDYFAPNDQQLRNLTGVDDLRAAARLVLEQGAGAVLVSCGPDGCILVTPDRLDGQSVPAVADAVVDTTGCGDACTAGFLVGVLRGWPLIDAAWLAMAAAGLVAGGLGSDAGITDLSSVVERLVGTAPPDVMERVRADTHANAPRHRIVDSPSLPAYNELPPVDGGGRSAWGVFGDRPSHGTVSMQTPDRIAAAAKLVLTGELFSLNAPVTWPDPPLFLRKAVEHTLLTEPDTPGFDERLDVFYPQGSSQWDSLAHVGYAPDRFYNGASAADIRAGTSNTIDGWARRGIAGRGVLLDIDAVLGGAGTGFDPGSARAISVADLEAARIAAGVSWEAGDILLLHTGWFAWYAGQPASVKEQLAIAEDFDSIGLERSEEMLAYLWDSHVSAVACDNPAVEVWPPRWNDGPFGFLHRMLIGQLGLALGELWWLHDLARSCRADGRYTCFLTSAPLNLPGGVGSPANALAVK
jgi:sugar/nucleoside kinase (ribokinase family)/kynurenine formamidase